jgi:dolichol-phosphate mannosyltransferase
MKAQRQTGCGEPEGAGNPDRVLLTLVVPTRNEVDNVPRLVRELREGLSDLDYRVVFVDDSTDGTPGVVRDLAGKDGRVRLVRREGAERRGGLSTAVTTGMDLFSGASEYTCVMDADLQHPPEKVHEMLEIARRTDADVVVASRYAPGGSSYAGLSGTARRAVSVGSKYLAQIVFKEARKTSDPMTGFFLIKNEAISGIQFRPTGFKVLLEILVCAPELKVVEAPFDFRARHAGVSKATLRQGFDYLIHILSLFWYVPSAGRFWKFCLVGASGVLVNMVTLIVLAEYFHAHKVIAWMFAVGISILSNFLLNNTFTWRDIRHSSRIHFFLRGVLAYPVAVMGIGANFAVWYPLVKYVSDEFPYYALFNLLGIIAGTSVNFILSSRLVFRPSMPRTLDPDAPPKEIVKGIRRELRADRVDLIRVPDLTSLEELSPQELTASDRSVIDLVVQTTHPTLTVTGPRRLPQARTNARWTNSLAVPILDEERAVGVVYVSRNSTEPFTEEDLHWLTAYTSTAAEIFE